MSGVKTLGGSKAKRLFDALLTARGEVVSKATVVELLWGDAPPRDVDRSVHAYVTVLRNRIQPGAAAAESVIVLDGDGFRFEPSRATAAAEDVPVPVPVRPVAPLAASSL